MRLLQGQQPGFYDGARGGGRLAWGWKSPQCTTANWQLSPSPCHHVDRRRDMRRWREPEAWGTLRRLFGRSKISTYDSTMST